jgi:myo-inositol-1(or 4)-monophosphatase
MIRMGTPTELLTVALAAADAASAVHLRHAGKVRMGEANEKRRSDFVSFVDVEAQEAALAVIRERFPDHAVLAEEEGGTSAQIDHLPSGAPVWVIDPLDGTTNYLHGHPAFAASVGVAIDGKGVAGAVVAGATEERWWGAGGAGAYRNGERIRTSPLRELRHSLVGTGFPFKHPEKLPDYLDEFGRVLCATSGIRREGAAAIDLCYLAQGVFDAFWEEVLFPWDIAAGIVILSEAGGVAVRRDGSPVDPTEGGPVIAANSPELLASFRPLLNP